MMLSETRISILLSCSLLSALVLSDHASFPLTAISHYSELAPCAASHISDILDSSWYDGCSSNTPISAYGSCICAQRLTSIQFGISVDFEYDAECSTTSVQPYLTAFCGQWGVDIGAVEKARPSSTTTLVGSGTARATPGSVGTPSLPTSTSTSSSRPTSGSGGGGLSGDQVTIVGTIVGSIAGIIAVVIAWKTLQYMRQQRHRDDAVNNQQQQQQQQQHWPASPYHGHVHEMEASPGPMNGWNGGNSIPQYKYR